MILTNYYTQVFWKKKWGKTKKPSSSVWTFRIVNARMMWKFIKGGKTPPFKSAVEETI